MLINKLTKTIFDKRYPKQARYIVSCHDEHECETCGETYEHEDSADSCCANEGEDDHYTWED